MNKQDYQKRYRETHREQSKKYHKKYFKQYYATHKGEILATNKIRYSRGHHLRYKYGQCIKRFVLSYYGDGKIECQICHENRPDCLSIDHINGDGYKHRKIIKTGKFYLWLIKNGFPEGFRTLCMNCQFIERSKKYEQNRLLKTV